MISNAEGGFCPVKRAEPESYAGGPLTYGQRQDLVLRWAS
jgi:hypothetical protein